MNHLVLPAVFTVLSALYIGVSYIDQQTKATALHQARIECATEATDHACEIAYGYDMEGNK